MADERLYAAQPELVFAALIHALAGLSARVERVEGYGTIVMFRASRAGDGDLPLFSAYVLPDAGGALVQVHRLDGIGAGTPIRSGRELIPGLLDAVQDRLERGPQARPTDLPRPRR